MRRTHWTDTELALLSSVDDPEDVRRLAHKIGRTDEAIRRKLKQHLGRSLSGRSRHGVSETKRRNRSDCVLSRI